MTHIGSVFFFIELFLAGFIFLYPTPKRKNWVLKLIVGLVIGCVLSYFFPIATIQGENSKTVIIQLQVLGRQFFIYALCFLLDAALFKLNLRMILSMAVAGLAVQHIAYNCTSYMEYIPLLQDFTSPVFTRRHIFEGITIPVVYFLAWLTIGRIAEKNEYYRSSDWHFDVLAIGVVVLNSLISRVPYLLGETGSVTLGIYSILSNVLALVIQFSLYWIASITYDGQVQLRMWEEEKKQYQITKDTIDAINIKCHDLKHRLNGIGSEQDKEELKNMILIYDNSIKTGNEVLDVMFMDYTLRFGKDGISYTFMGDGKALSFLTESELYSVFGNALENATEAVQKLDDRQKKTIGITVATLGAFVVVTVQNYFDGKVIMRHDRLETTKLGDVGNHGFGTKSMKKIAEKYQGEMKITVNGDIFTLKLSFLNE